jgi:hypothetical protein
VEWSHVVVPEVAQISKGRIRHSTENGEEPKYSQKDGVRGLTLFTTRQHIARVIVV